MGPIELAFAVCTALAMVGGFVFEWRRQGAQDQRVGAVEGRCENIEMRLATVEQWRDRMGRTW